MDYRGIDMAWKFKLQQLERTSPSLNSAELLCNTAVPSQSSNTGPTIMAAPPGFPVRSLETETTLNGIPCNVITSVYADRIMFIVTQLGTLGTIVHAKKDEVLGGGTTFSISTLLGNREDPLPELCARQLIEKLGETGLGVPVLLCLGLKKDSDAAGDLNRQRELVKAVVDICLENKVW